MPVPSLYVLTGFLPSNKTIEVQVAHVFGNGGQSEWSETELVNTATDGSGGNPLPGDPGYGGGPGGTGEVV